MWLAQTRGGLNRDCACGNAAWFGKKKKKESGALFQTSACFCSYLFLFVIYQLVELHPAPSVGVSDCWDFWNLQRGVRLPKPIWLIVGTLSLNSTSMKKLYSLAVTCCQCQSHADMRHKLQRSSIYSYSKWPTLNAAAKTAPQIIKCTRSRAVKKVTRGSVLPEKVNWDKLDLTWLQEIKGSLAVAFCN